MYRIEPASKAGLLALYDLMPENVHLLTTGQVRNLVALCLQPSRLSEWRVHPAFTPVACLLTYMLVSRQQWHRIFQPGSCSNCAETAMYGTLSKRLLGFTLWPQ